VAIIVELLREITNEKQKTTADAGKEEEDGVCKGKYMRHAQDRVLHYN
jgi:hypothetical protein